VQEIPPQRLTSKIEIRILALDEVNFTKVG
jgi:hypothetical protein